MSSVDALSLLRLLAAGVAPSVKVLGHGAPHDGGGGQFEWLPNFNLDDDDGIIVKPDSLSPGQPGRWHRKFSGEISVKWFGARGNGDADDTDAIQKAEDAAATNFGPSPILHFPEGTYIIGVAPEREVHDNPMKQYGIFKKSRVDWVGVDRDASVLKLKDRSLVTDEVDPQMIYCDDRLEDVGFYRLGFDLNGQLNPIEGPDPDKPCDKVRSLHNAAAMWFDGGQLEVHGLRIEDCRFANGPGGSVIVVENTVTGTTYRNRYPDEPTRYPIEDVSIDGNLFQDNCLSGCTDDHSTLNIWARRTVVSNNHFSISSAANVPDAQRYYHAAAVEFHGADGVFSGNTISSYGRVVIPSENYIEDWSGLRVTHNRAWDIGTFFVTTEVQAKQESKSIDGIVIDHNCVRFNDKQASGYKAALHLFHHKRVSRIEVSNNWFERAASREPFESSCIQPHAAVPSPEATTDYLKVTANVIVGMGAGVLVDNANRLPSVGRVDFVNNTCIDLYDGSPNKRSTGLWLDGSTTKRVTANVRRNRFRWGQPDDPNDADKRNAVFKNPHADLNQSVLLLNDFVNLDLAKAVEDHP